MSLSVGIPKLAVALDRSWLRYLRIPRNRPLPIRTSRLHLRSPKTKPTLGRAPAVDAQSLGLPIETICHPQMISPFVIHSMINSAEPVKPWRYATWPLFAEQLSRAAHLLRHILLFGQAIANL